MNRLNKFGKNFKNFFEDDSRNIDENSENFKTVNHINDNKDNFRIKDKLQTVSNKNNNKLTAYNKYIMISKNYLKNNINNINDNTTFINNDSNIKKNSINYINNIDVDINGMSSERKLNNFNEDNSIEKISLYKLNKNKNNYNKNDSNENISILNLNKNKRKEDLKSNNDSLNENISNEKNVTVLIPKGESIEIKLNKQENIPNCILCGKIFPLINIYSTKLCNHYFCQNCLKRYYMKENLNDLNIYKCPILSCNQYFEKEIIKNKIFNPNISNDKIEILKSFNESRKKNDINNFVIKYKTNNLIDINSNKPFFFYSKYKKEICPFCNENKIFSNNNYCVCLNCQKKYCKYCNNIYNENHFNQKNVFRCKIYYKINDEDYKTIINMKKKSIYLKFLFSFILVLAGYFCFVIGYIKQIKISIKNVFFCNYINKNIFFYYVIYFFYVICLLCVLFIIIPFFILIIPYFPIISIIN